VIFSPLSRRLPVICAVFGCVILGAACGNGDPEPRIAPAEASPTKSAAATAEVELDDRLLADLPIGDQPDWIAAGLGSVWVGRDEAAAVDRIDPASNEVVATIDVGTHPCNGLVVGFGSVWVPSCEEQALYRIDPVRGKVAAVIDLPVFRSTAGSLTHELATGAGAVWMVTQGKKGAFDALARINPRTNEVVSTISIGHEGTGVAVGEDAVWVAAPDDDLVVRVDARTERVVAKVDGIPAPNFLVFEGGGVWALSGLRSDRTSGDGGVARIDPATNEVVARVEIDERGGQAGDLVAGMGAVWARTQFTLLAKIDPTTNEIAERVVDQKGLGGISTGFGSVWIADFAFNRVWRLAPQ
jgi:virginiamycin B lyase